MILTGETQAHVDLGAIAIGVLVGLGGAEGLPRPAPDDALVGVRGEPGGIQVIGVQIKELLLL